LLVKIYILLLSGGNCREGKSNWHALAKEGDRESRQ
jgi:hypothetical protein